MQTKEQVLEYFRYKKPTEDTVPKYEAVTDLFVNAVDTLWDVTPDGPGKTVAFRKLSEAQRAFNTAIANGGQ